jgi:hypothetical protein
MKKTTVLIVTTLLVGIIFSCKRDKHIPNVCFKENIQPIFISKCANPGCHNPTDKAEGLDLTTYEGALNVVKPGRSLFSKLWLRVRGNNPSMPPKSHKPLSKQEQDYIKYWIDFGAENSSCGNTSCDTLGFLTYSGTVKPLMDLHCAGCHPGGSPTGHSLDNYNGVKNSVNTGKLMPSVDHSGSKPMPLGGNKLPACDIAKLKKWIDNGMPQ